MDLLPHVQIPANDLQFILKALCERRCATFYSNFGDKWTEYVWASYAPVGLKPLPFHIVASFLRLGRKYDIQLLLNEAIARLTYEFPSTLAHYDAMEDFSMIEDSSTLIYDTIRLARDSDLPSVLPSAFLICCQIHSFKEIFDGMHRSDGRHATLSPEDQRICILGW